jgi:hypothetical protein
MCVSKGASVAFASQVHDTVRSTFYPSSVAALATGLESNHVRPKSRSSHVEIEHDHVTVNTSWAVSISFIPFRTDVVIETGTGTA